MSETRVSGAVVPVPFRGGEVLAVEIDGKPNIVLKPFVESLGIDYSSQVRKLRNRSWAVMGETPTTGADGKTYVMTTVDVRTALMLLATINENNLSDELRPLLVAYQSEVADVIEAYFTKGGVINPSATEDQLDRLTRQAQSQAAVLNSLRGIVDAHYLEAKGRMVLARALGEEPELNPDTLPVDVETYLRDRGVGTRQRERFRGEFGKRLKGRYMARYGKEPARVPRTINGVVTPVNGYTRQDLDLFGHVFESMGLVDA